MAAPSSCRPMKVYGWAKRRGNAQSWRWKENLSRRQTFASKQLSAKVVEACHIPGKGHEIVVKSSAIGPFPECFWTQLSSFISKCRKKRGARQAVPLDGVQLGAPEK